MNTSNEATCKKIQNYIFKFADLLGQGNFSKVYKAHNEITNETVAIKIIQLNSLKSKKLQELLFSEIQVLKKLNHTNILRCHEVFTSNRNCYIITELCNQGDLQSKLRGLRNFSQQKAISIIRDIYLGLEYLSDKNVIHRDLKIANIFMHNGKAKIADFGFAKFTKSKFKDINIGSPIYMSPEGLIENVYGPKTDVWAFGIMIYELLHGQTPFSHCKTQSELKYSISIPIGWTKFKSQLSSQIKQVMLKCLQIKQDKRYTITQLRELPFFQKILVDNNNQNSTSIIGKSMNDLTKNKSFQQYKNERFSMNKSSNNSNWKQSQSINNNYRKQTVSNMPKNHNNRSYNDTQQNKQEKSNKTDDFYNNNLSKFAIEPKGNTNQPYLNGINNGANKYSSTKKELTPNQTEEISMAKSKDNFSPFGYKKNSQSQNIGNKILSVNINFKASVNILHYCRLIYKYVTISSMMKGYKMSDDNQKSIFVRWLAVLVKIINTRIQNREVIYEGQNAGLREQKLKQVSKEYQKKYSKQLNLNMSKINPQQYTIANYEYMINFILSVYQDIDSLLNENNNRDNKSLLMLGHYVVMILQATRILKKCYDEKNYLVFEQYREIQNLLNMKKEDMDLPSFWWYKKKFKPILKE